MKTVKRHSDTYESGLLRVLAFSTLTIVLVLLLEDLLEANFHIHTIPPKTDYSLEFFLP